MTTHLCLTEQILAVRGCPPERATRPTHQLGCVAPETAKHLTQVEKRDGEPGGLTPRPPPSSGSTGYQVPGKSHLIVA